MMWFLMREILAEIAVRVRSEYVKPELPVVSRARQREAELSVPFPPCNHSCRVLSSVF